MAVSADAQILFLAPTAITGPSDISTLGTFVDALGANHFGSSVTIGDTVFTTFFGSDSHINFSGPVAGGSDGSGSTATPFLTVMDGVAFAGFSDTSTILFGTADISGLTLGHTYQVQVFNDGGRLTNIISANSVQLSHSFTTGSFVAAASTASFTFSSPNASDAGEISAITLRDITTVPEPSTWAMALAGGRRAGLCRPPPVRPRPRLSFGFASARSATHPQVVRREAITSPPS